MRDYLEELLEELAEEGDILSLSQSVRRAVSSLVRGSQGDTGAGERQPDEGIGPYIPGPKETEDGETRERAGALSVGFADSSPIGGALGQEARAHIVRPYGMAAELVRRLRRGAMAAGYRANTPAALEIPERSYVREQSLLELDAAVRRDARRYDGEMTLY